MVNDSPGVYFNHLPIFKMAAIRTLKPRWETCGGGYKCRRGRRGMSSLSRDHRYLVSTVIRFIR